MSAFKRSMSEAELSCDIGCTTEMLTLPMAKARGFLIHPEIAFQVTSNGHPRLLSPQALFILFPCAPGYSVDCSV